MEVSKKAYFYFKLEDEPYTDYKNGWHEWYMEYFCREVHVSDNSGNDIIAPSGTIYLVPPDTLMYFNYENTDSFTHKRGFSARNAVLWTVLLFLTECR